MVMYKKHNCIFQNLICGWAGGLGGGAPQPPKAENFELNKTPPLDKKDFEVEERGFLFSNPMYLFFWFCGRFQNWFQK